MHIRRNRNIVGIVFHIVLFGAFCLFLSPSNTAFASTLNYSSPTSIYLSTPDTYFVIQSGSTADALVVGSSTVAVTLAAGDVFTINATSSDFSISLTSGSGSTYTSSVCSDAAAASITITQTTASSTYAISQASICHSSSSPAPTVSSISPSSALAGGGAFTLTVNGANFLPSSVVYWGGSPLTTTYASTTVLTASVPAPNIASAGMSYVYVSTPAPGGGVSGDKNFVIYSSSGYEAYNVLGQFDADGNPSYANRWANNNANNNFGFNAPKSTAIDAVNHRLFASDGYRVLVFNLNSSNQLVDYEADYVLGKPGFDPYYTSEVSADGLSNPAGLAYDSAGNRLFVADKSKNRVLVFSLASLTTGMSASYVLGQASFTSSVAATTQAGMSSPDGLVYDSVGNNLFVADQGNNRVLVFGLASLSTGMNASYVLGQADFSANTAATTQSGLSAPTGLAHDSVGNRLFVGDKSNNRVLMFNLASLSTGMNSSYVLGQINATSSDLAASQAGMNGPSGVAYDSLNNRLFVSDFGSYRVLIFNVASGTIATGMNASFVLGQTNFTGDSGYTSTWASQNKFSNANAFSDNDAGILFNPADSKLFVSDVSNNRFLIFSVATGTVSNGMNASGVLGQYGSAWSSDYTKNFAFGAPNSIGLSGGVDGAESYSAPNHFGTALDLNGQRLFVSDFDNNRVLVFNLDSSGNPLDYEADYVLGQADLYSRSTTTVGQNKLRKPSGLAFDSVNNRLFVADYSNNRVLIFDVANIASGMNAAFVLGQTNFTNRTLATSQTGLGTPLSLAYDSLNSRLFVSSQAGRRVVIYDVATGTVSNGKAASFVLGQTTFTASSASLTQSGMNVPNALAYDSANSRLFVADYSYNRVTIFSVATGTVSNGMNASFVLGQTIFTSQTSGRTQSKMNGPAGLAYDSSSDKLFVSDSTNQRVLAFDVPSGSVADGQDASAVFGKSDFTSSSGTNTKTGLSYSTGVSYDSVNRHLIVSDTEDSRIMFYRFFTPGSPSFPSAATMGNGYSYTLPTPTNYQGTVAYSVTSGAVPPGLHFSASTLSGTPTAAGVYSFSIQAQDVGSWGAISTVAIPGTHTITVITNPGSAVLVGTSSGGGGGGGYYSSPVAATSTVPSASVATSTAAAGTSSGAPSTSPSASVGTSVAFFARNLYYGLENSSDVTLLQQTLTKLGFYSGPVTGNFYSLTQKAVIAFQKEHNITPAVGYVGILTRNVLNSAGPSGTISAPSTRVSFSKDLYYGIDGSSDVTLLQQTLTKLGFYSGPVTGNFYSLTQKAVIAFQKEHNITPAVGYVGVKTRGVLNGI